MMWPSPFPPYEGGPTVIEWLKQVCDKFNELLAAVKNVRELPAGGSHGQVPTPREDGAGYEWVDQSGGGGGTSDLLWKPTVSSTGIISWERSSSTTAPASQNIKGPQGLIGPQGPQGPKGPDGPKGDTGPVGPAGPQGATGPQGPKGTDGAVGPQGPEGPAGPKGDTGPVGPQGPKGSDGAIGPAGPIGPEGPAGPKGADGATPTFEVGSVTKLAPDAEPTVTLENVGGDLYMMDFGIPQGQPGTPGGGGGGGGDVTAAGNNVFTGTNRFEGLTVLAETNVPTPNDNDDATNKLYVDTLVANTKTSTVEEVNAHTDERVNALRVLPAGGTSGQVPTIASDGATVEWKTPETGGGGSGGGGVEWIPVALEKQGVVRSTLSLFYDKADNTHLKLVGDFSIPTGRYNQASFLLPVDNPLNFYETVYASVSITAIYTGIPYESQCFNYLLVIDGREFILQKNSQYINDYTYIVGCEFYIIKNVTTYSPGLPGPTTPTDPTYPGPTEGAMNEPTAVE